MNKDLKQQFIDQIKKFEYEAGESFADYFMHDNVKDLSWSFWLLGKGFTERALEIISEIEKGETCIDQELLYFIYPDPDDTNNIYLWAEFLSATPSYITRTQRFFKELEY